MSVHGYFTKRKTELRMQKTEDGRDALGIQWEGSVLGGHMSLEEKLECEAAKSLPAGSRIRDLAPGGLNYIPPTEYLIPREDPRLERDPVYERQRQQLGRPELYDPVLRFHLRLDPLPDPYERRQKREEAPAGEQQVKEEGH